MEDTLRVLLYNEDFSVYFRIKDMPEIFRVRHPRGATDKVKLDADGNIFVASNGIQISSMNCIQLQSNGHTEVQRIWLRGDDFYKEDLTVSFVARDPEREIKRAKQALTEFAQHFCITLIINGTTVLKPGEFVSDDSLTFWEL